jgi:transposase-like protein
MNRKDGHDINSGLAVEVSFEKMNGKPRFLWKAIDADGEMLDIYVTETRDEAAARQFFAKALKDPWSPARIRSGTSTRRRMLSVLR